MSHILKRIEREMKYRQRSRAQVWARRITIGVLSLATPIMCAELALRLTGYSRPQIDFSAQEKSLRLASQKLNDRFQTNAFEFDPHLFWKLKPGTNLGGIDVDSKGLLSWEHKTTEGPRQGVPLTVLCVGDSVTALTYRTYPQIAEQLALAAGNSKAVHFYSAAVPGYTTEQALRYLPELRSLNPDVVIFCFGWNDHFPALNLPDKELGASNAGFAALHDLLRNVRLYQLAGAPLSIKNTESAIPTPKTLKAANTDYRVGPDQFESNLTELVAITRSWKATPVLATEPENLKAVAEDFLEKNRFVAPDGRDNHRLHSSYNEIIRQVAASQKAPLLDLEDEFIRRPRDYMLEPDGIHLTGRGHNHVARLVLGMLRNEGLITTGDYDAIAKAERHDTTAPDKPRITWTLVPEYLSVPTGSDFSFSAVPQNSGNTRWLKENIVKRFGTRTNVSYGSSSIYARWRTLGSPDMDIAGKLPLPSDILPGEATSITMTLKSPPKPGNYELEVGIMADEIGSLSLYGAESTTLTVTATAKP